MFPCSVIRNYIVTPTVSAAISSGATYASKHLVPVQYNPLTTTLPAAALLAGTGAFVNVIAQRVLTNTNATFSYISSTAATLASVGAVSWINNHYLVKYAPSFGQITPKGALAIAAIVLVVQIVTKAIAPAQKARAEVKAAEKAMAEVKAVETASAEVKALEKATAEVKALEKAKKEFAAIDLKLNNEAFLSFLTRKNLIQEPALSDLRKSEGLVTYKEFVIEAVKINGLALQCASVQLKNDPEVVLAAIAQNGEALEYASSALRQDRNIILAAVKQRGHAYRHAPYELQIEREFAFEAVKISTHIIYYLPKELQTEIIAALKKSQ
jgi:hypothetical protein